MFDEEISTTKLTDRIEELLGRFEEMKEQNEKLRQEVVTLKAQNEVKDTQIAKLEEEVLNKDVEADDILGKIEEVLRR